MVSRCCGAAREHSYALPGMHRGRLSLCDAVIPRWGIVLRRIDPQGGPPAAMRPAGHPYSCHGTPRNFRARWGSRSRRDVPVPEACRRHAEVFTVCPRLFTAPRWNPEAQGRRASGAPWGREAWHQGHPEGVRHVTVQSVRTNNRPPIDRLAPISPDCTSSATRSNPYNSWRVVASIPTAMLPWPMN